MTGFTTTFKEKNSMNWGLKNKGKKDEIWAKSTEKPFKFLIKCKSKMMSFKFWSSVLLAKFDFLFTGVMASD